MSHQFTSSLRRWSVVLAVAMPMVLIGPAQAIAGAPSTIPVITAPADGSTITNELMTVTATSSATFVTFIVDNRMGDFNQVVPVTSGEASAQFSLLGLRGPTPVTAYDCAGPVSCNVDSASITVDIDLTNPVITSPDAGYVVKKSILVNATAPGGTLKFYLNGQLQGQDNSAPYSFLISLDGRRDGEYIASARQCNQAGDVCQGEVDKVTVIKDTQGPKFSDLSTSQRTVFPAKDNYKDTTKLSARVGEKSLDTKIEIRKAGGPLVRILKLGRVDRGRIAATWNGRKTNGDIVPKGKYLFRFVGTDVNGVVGKSNDKAVYVSDKKLVKKTVNKTVSALSSGVKDYSGGCSDVVGIRYIKGYGRDWPGGLQWRSNVRRNCTGDASVALSAHVTRAEKAIRYGTLRISAYGGASLSRGGSAKLLYVKANGNVGARQTLGTGLGWHSGDRVDLKSYLIGSKLLWFVGTANGNWYDIKEFKVTYTVWVLR